MSASRVLGLMIVSSWLVVGCSGAKKIDVGGACILNSDCNGSLVCTEGKCHDACHTSGDCPVGQSCIIASDQSRVCQLPVETHCLHDSNCPTSLKCAADQRCHNQCQTNVDCPSGQTCTTTQTCAEPNQVDSNNNLIAADGGVSGSGGASGAGGTGSCQTGAETCSCYPNDTCNAGLTCASHLCVRLGSGGSGGAKSGGGAPAGGSGGIAAAGGALVGGHGGIAAVGGTAAGGNSLTTGSTGGNGTAMPTNGLVAYFPFNGNNQDESGNGNDLSQSTATLVNDRFGHANSAFRFSGATDVMLSQKLLGIAGSEPRTISLWLRVISATPGGQVIVLGKKDTVTYNSSFGLAEDSSTLCGTCSDHTFLLWACGDGDWHPGIPQHLGIWEHHVIQYDGSTVYWYVNGVRSAETYARGYQTIDGTISVGRLPVATSAPVNADIDDIRIYNRALTDEEILLLYNESPDGTGSSISPNPDASADSSAEVPNGTGGMLGGGDATGKDGSISA